MAAPVIESYTGLNQDSLQSTATYTKPTGTASGDLLVLLISLGSGSSLPITPPDGTWTQVYSKLDASSGASNDGNVQAFWKAAGGSEPSSYIFTAASASRSVGVLLRISGADTTTPVNVFSALDDGSFGNITNPTCPSVTTTAADCLLLYSVADSTGGSDRSYTGIPAGTSLVFAAQNSANSASRTGAAFASESIAAAGATGTGEFTYSAGASFAMASLAIAPAAGGGGTDVSVEASSGSIGITGQTGSATATANRTVRASAGSLGITGQAGHVVASDAKSVSATSGTIGVSGQTAHVAATANVAVQANAGSVSIAGQGAVVAATANKTIEAGSGSIGISGSQGAVSVTANQNVRAASGSISISGQQGSVSTSASISIEAQAGSIRVAGAGCHVRVTQSAFVEAVAGRLSIRGQMANVSTRSKSRGDDAGPRHYSQWAAGIRPIRVIYDEEDVREALGEPKANASPAPTKAKKRKLVRDVERKVLGVTSLPAMFAPAVERAVSHEIGMRWKGPSDWEVLSAILNVAAQKAVEEIQRIEREIEDEDEMLLILAA